MLLLDATMLELVDLYAGADEDRSDSDCVTWPWAAADLFQGAFLTKAWTRRKVENRAMMTDIQTGAVRSPPRGS